MPTDRDYAECMELVEAVMEWIGMRWTVSMIKRELREYFGNDLSFMTCNYLIKAAKAEIRKRYNIDPQYYKGVQIEFYESIIRNRYEKTKERLTAAERLDKLFGLEQITADDPEIQARKIREFLKEADESIGEQDGGVEKSNEEDKTGAESVKQGSLDGGQGENDQKAIDGIGKKKEKTVEQTESEVNKRDKPEDPETGTGPIVEGDNISQESAEEIKNLKEEDMKRFRKGK